MGQDFLDIQYSVRRLVDILPREWSVGNVRQQLTDRQELIDWKVCINIFLSPLHCLASIVHGTI